MSDGEFCVTLLSCIQLWLAVCTIYLLVKKGSEIVTLLLTMQALVARINTATNTIATEIRDLKAKVIAANSGGGMTQAEEDEIAAGLEAAATRLEAIANTDPETVAVDPNKTSAVTVPKTPGEESFSEFNQRQLESQRAPGEVSGASSSDSQSDSQTEASGIASEATGGSGDGATPTNPDDAKTDDSGL